MRKANSLQDIADEAGVSKATVSLALRNNPRISEDVRTRIQSIASAMKYQFNPFVAAQMAQIRITRKRKLSPTIGFITTFDHVGDKEHGNWATIGEYLKGAKRRAKELGFKVELFQYNDEEISGARLQQILVSRGIEGLILPPLRYPDYQIPVEWSHFCTCAIGYYENNGPHHTVFYDNFQCLQQLMHRLLAKGFKRIGFVTNNLNEERGRHMWSGSFLNFQHRNLQKKNQIPILKVSRNLLKSENEKEMLLTWFKRYRPEVIIGFKDYPLTILSSCGYKVVTDFSYVTVNWDTNIPNVSGYYQNLQYIGEVATEIVAGRLYRNERGFPAQNRTTLVQGIWIDGKTLK